MPASAPFSTELTTFEEHREQWCRSHPGEYVVILDDVILDGFFSTYAEALKAGLERFGVSRSFLIKQIWVTDPVYFVS